jgi:hypothetical protein
MSRTVRQSGDRIKKGMVVAISCSAKPHKYMGGQPFWLAKYLLDSTPHHTLVLRRQVFAALHAFAQRGQYQGTSSRGAMRRSLLHWNITFVGQKSGHRGRLSAGDQKVLELDDRVPWKLPSKEGSSSSQGKGCNSSRKRKALSPPQPAPALAPASAPAPHPKSADTDVPAKTKGNNIVLFILVVLLMVRNLKQLSPDQPAQFYGETIQFYIRLCLHARPKSSLELYGCEWCA